MFLTTTFVYNKGTGTMNTQMATYNEISSQPQAWQAALDAVGRQAEALQQLWSKKDYSQVVFTGCGSTYYLALAAAALFQELIGQAVRVSPAGELVMYPATTYSSGGPALLVAFSRSAATTETIQAAKNFRQSQSGDVLTITNYGDQPLAEMGTITIDIPEGQEESVAQTRSFASMYVAASALAALLAGRDDLLQAMQGLPELGRNLIARYEAFVQPLGENLKLDRFYFLGSGPRYGLACEANLKMKEMTLTHSEPFHFLEFRHGPISMAGPTALVIGLLSDSNHKHEAAVLEDVRQLGGKTLTLGEGDTDITFNSQLPEAIRNVLYLPPLQLLAYYRALAKGLNPDRPNNLESVVRLAW
jgi:glucosamine--fructose-6-phosphate aminotransferase (isomerizing)